MEVPSVVPVEQRRPGDRRPSRPTDRDRQQDREEKALRPSFRREQEMPVAVNRQITVAEGFTV
jgi:hypothetical protein